MPNSGNIQLMRDTEIQGVVDNCNVPIDIPLENRDVETVCPRSSCPKHPTWYTIIQDIHCRDIISQLEIVIPIPPLMEHQDVRTVYRLVVSRTEFQFPGRVDVISLIVWILVVVFQGCGVRRAGDVRFQGLPVR